MALFDREETDLGSDLASRALSVTPVENAFVEGVYEKLAKVYDLTFGPTLHPGRLVALDPRKVFPIELAKRVLRGRDPAFAPTHKAFGVAEYDGIIRQGGRFRVETARRVGLLSLLVMAGFDALGWSRRLRNPQSVVDALRGADRWLFRVPGLERAGLNLAVRAVRQA